MLGVESLRIIKVRKEEMRTKYIDHYYYFTYLYMQVMKIKTTMINKQTTMEIISAMTWTLLPNIPTEEIDMVIQDYVTQGRYYFCSSLAVFTSALGASSHSALCEGKNSAACIDILPVKMTDTTMDPIRSQWVLVGTDPTLHHSWDRTAQPYQ